MQAHPLVERIVSEQVENLPTRPRSEEGKCCPACPETKLHERARLTR